MVESLKKTAFQELNLKIVNPDRSTLALKPRDMALALLEDVVADLDEKWGGGEMSAAVYDTAWVAMVRDPHDPKKLAFPHSFNWLLKHQAADGSWGGPFPYPLLPTLATLLALLKAPEPTEESNYAVERAKAYLRNAFTQWSVNDHESIGFEVLAPSLFEELEKLGVVFEFQGKGELLKIRSQKLLIAAPELIYSGQSNLIHSLEAFGSSLDFKRLKQQQATNGSYGASPSATAAVLIYGPEWDSAAAEWLTHLSNRAFDGVKGGMPNAYPIDAFEGAWVLYNLASAIITTFINGEERYQVLITTVPLTEKETIANVHILVKKTGNFLLDLLYYVVFGLQTKATGMEDIPLWSTMNPNAGGAYVKHDAGVLKYRNFYQIWVDKVE